MKTVLVALAALLTILGASHSTQAQILETYSLGYPIQIRVVSIAAGETVRFRTDYTLTPAPGGGFGDTVLSLVEIGGGYLAGADSWDCATPAFKWEPSCFQYTNSSSLPKVAYLIARAWHASTPSFVRLYRNDAYLPDPAFGNDTSKVYVGGGWMNTTLWTWARNHVTTAFLPGDAAAHLLIAGSNDNFGSPEVVYGIFEDNSEVVTGLAEIDQFGLTGLASQIGIAYGGRNRMNEGPLRLLKNDWYLSTSDFDGDGLGHALEIDLGTCDRPTDTMPNGELCSTLEFCDMPGSPPVCLAHLRDTDHDGLRDDVEVYGYDHLQAQLPRWGANPVHRDVFVEMNAEDQDTTAGGCQGFQIGPLPDPFATDPRLMGGEVLSPAVVGLPAPSDLDFFDRARRIYAQAPDWMNPDGTPGINIHFDVGIENPDPTTATLWGDWGGGGDCFDTTDDVQKDGNYGTLCANDVEAARSWLFHCAIDTTSGAGQANGASWYGMARP